MEPTSHTKRNILILLVIALIVILIMVKKNDSRLQNGPAGLSDREKAALIEELSNQADATPVNLTSDQKAAALKDIQASSTGGGSINLDLTEEQKAQLIKQAGKNN